MMKKTTDEENFVYGEKIKSLLLGVAFGFILGIILQSALGLL